MAADAGLVPEHLWSVSPGAYGRVEPTLESEELLLIARRA